MLLTSESSLRQSHQGPVIASCRRGHLLASSSPLACSLVSRPLLALCSLISRPFPSISLSNSSRSSLSLSTLSSEGQVSSTLCFKTGNGLFVDSHESVWSKSVFITELLELSQSKRKRNNYMRGSNTKQKGRKTQKEETLLFTVV